MAKPAPDPTLSSGPLHTPRIVAVLAVLALLYGANIVAPKIIPAVIGLLVLYALLTNVPRFVALLDAGQASLESVIAPNSVLRRLPPGHTS